MLTNWRTVPSSSQMRSRSPGNSRPSCSRHSATVAASVVTLDSPLVSRRIGDGIFTITAMSPHL